MIRCYKLSGKGDFLVQMWRDRENCLVLWGRIPEARDQVAGSCKPHGGEVGRLRAVEGVLAMRQEAEL